MSTIRDRRECCGRLLLAKNEQEDSIIETARAKVKDLEPWQILQQNFDRAK